MYSASLGRFLQTDPIGYLGDLNPYRYCANDPMSRIDPFGLQASVEKAFRRQLESWENEGKLVFDTGIDNYGRRYPLPPSEVKVYDYDPTAPKGSKLTPVERKLSPDEKAAIIGIAVNIIPGLSNWSFPLELIAEIFYRGCEGFPSKDGYECE